MTDKMTVDVIKAVNLAHSVTFDIHLRANKRNFDKSAHVALFVTYMLSRLNYLAPMPNARHWLYLE